MPSPSRMVNQKVYPRVGGGNPHHSNRGMQWQGLSPRGRGKRVVGAPVAPQPGSIPAWAGETVCRCRYAARPGVYPRVGGGNAIPTDSETPRAGLSPRGRGKLCCQRCPRRERRSIPAWAGETMPNRSRQRPLGVYPRVGGGNGISLAQYAFPSGLSPRGRGKLCARLDACRLTRSIPAWAGETYLLSQRRRCKRVYPRVGGGNR